MPGITIISASQTGNARRVAEALRDDLLAAKLNVKPVSYTHLDVYKRQDNYRLPKQRRAEWANAIFAGGNAGLALLHPGGAFYSRHAVYHP